MFLFEAFVHMWFLAMMPSVAQKAESLYRNSIPHNSIDNVPIQFCDTGYADHWHSLWFMLDLDSLVAQIILPIFLWINLTFGTCVAHASWNLVLTLLLYGKELMGTLFFLFLETKCPNVARLLSWPPKKYWRRRRTQKINFKVRCCVLLFTFLVAFCLRMACATTHRRQEGISVLFIDLLLAANWNTSDAHPDDLPEHVIVCFSATHALELFFSSAQLLTSATLQQILGPTLCWKLLMLHDNTGRCVYSVVVNACYQVVV